MSGCMREEELDKNGDLARAYEHDKDADDARTNKKPYRFIEDYCVEGTNGAFESLDLLRKRARPVLTLKGKLCPREDSEGEGRGQLEVSVPISSWSIYAHPEEKYRGVWLRSKTAEYHLGRPSASYEGVVRDLLGCVSTAITMHLFITDVVGLEDMADADDQSLNLNTLVELMDGHGVSRKQVEDNAGEIHDLLRDLHVSKNLTFMAELRALKPSKSRRSSAGCSSSGASTESPTTTTHTNGNANGKQRASLTKSGEGDSCAKASGSSKGRRSKASSSSSSPSSHAALNGHAHTSGPSGESGPSSEPHAGDQPQGKTKRRQKSSSSASTSTSEVAAESTANGEAVSEPLVPASSMGDLKISEEVPKILNALAGLSHRLVRLIEEARPAGMEKQLLEVERLLDRLDAEGFEPMAYLLAGRFGGESFFHPFFELYRVLKRIRLSCPVDQRERVSVLRRRLVTHYTDHILRDVWYVMNRNEMKPEVRVLKDQEKAVWVEAKRKRRDAEKEGLRAEKEKRRAEKEERRRAWEVGHLERKEQRRLARLQQQQEQQEAEAAAAAGTAEDKAHAGGNVSGVKRPAEGHQEEASGKRPTLERDENEGQAMQVDDGSEQPVATAAASADTAGAMARLCVTEVASVSDGGPMAESKCTLSPVVCNGGGRAMAAAFAPAPGASKNKDKDDTATANGNGLGLHMQGHADVPATTPMVLGGGAQ